MRIRPNCHNVLIECLESRALLSGYSLTSLSWVPKTAAGYQPISITNGGEILVSDADSPQDGTQHVYAITPALSGEFDIMSLGRGALP
jgi:hypothetical protein